MPTASSVWNTAAQMKISAPIARICAARSAGASASTNTPVSSLRNTMNTVAQRVIHRTAIVTEAWADLAARARSPSPMCLPTRLVAAVESPTAGMNEMCTNRIAAQPAVMCALPKPPASTVMKIAQQTISLPNCSPAGQPRRSTSRMAGQCGLQARDTANSRSSPREKNTTSGTASSTAVPMMVPIAAPSTPYAGAPGTPGSPSSGSPRSP